MYLKYDIKTNKNFIIKIYNINIIYKLNLN